MKLLPIAFFVLAVAILGPVEGSLQAAPPVALTDKAMGTTWSVRYVPPPTALEPAAVKRRLAERIEALEAIFSTYRPNSELSRFNASASTDPTGVSLELVTVAREAKIVSELTNGGFDATVLPLVQLWGFGTQRRTDSLPSAQAIASARSKVDWRRLQVDSEGRWLRKARSDVAVDFSSMAKGYAVDRVCAELRGMGIVDCFVQIGGDLATAGSREGKPWRAGVELPRDGPGELACTLDLSSQALSTSGDQRNFFRVGSRRYGHIIDPRRGEPVEGDLASVSVIAATCARSSALATGLFVLGWEEGFRVASEHQIAGLFIVRQDDRQVLRATPEFRRLFPTIEVDSVR